MMSQILIKIRSSEYLVLWIREQKQKQNKNKTKTKQKNKNKKIELGLFQFWDIQNFLYELYLNE